MARLESLEEDFENLQLDHNMPRKASRVSANELFAAWPEGKLLCRGVVVYIVLYRYSILILKTKKLFPGKCSWRRTWTGIIESLILDKTTTYNLN